MGGIHIDRLFPRRMREIFAQRLRQVAAEFGVPMNEEMEHVPNTRAALALTEWARCTQGEEAMARFRDAAMDAWWARGEDIEAPEVLRALAKSAGLDPDAALHASTDPQWLHSIDQIRQESHARGVTGIPTFFFGDQKVVGCQPYKTLALLLSQAGASLRTQAPSKDEAATQEPGLLRQRGL